MTHNAYDKLFKRFTPEQLAQTKIGYDKAKEFIRRFVAAGGILKEGSDPPRGMAAMRIHEAIDMDVEAGVPPLTAIKAATLVPAQSSSRIRITAAWRKARSPLSQSSRAIRVTVKSPGEDFDESYPVHLIIPSFQRTALSRWRRFCDAERIAASLYANSCLL